jgi:putative aldouronate transport system substrate-binding protein
MLKFRVIAVVTLVFILVLSINSVFAKTKTLTEITALAWDRGIIPQDQGNIEDNWWTRLVNEKMAKLGFKVRFIPVPRAQEAQKLPTMLAAGDAPDICFSYDKALYGTYVKNGALLDYTDYIKKYGKNIKKQFTNEDLMLGAVNGRIYSIVYRSVSTADTTWIRKDWLDKLGLKEPSNPTEFYNMLKAFKEKDPGKVGDKLVPFAFSSSPNYPFGIWYATVLPGFVKTQPSPDRLFEQVYPMWPETKDCMRFLNKLYNEKLLTDQFLIDRDGVLFKQKFVEGDIGALGNFAHWPYHNAYGNMYENMQKNIPDAKVEAIFPWKNEQSKDNYINFIRNAPYGYMWFSPKSAKRPDLVVKYLDWLASEEGCTTGWFGQEGSDYKLNADGIPIPIDTAKYTARVPWITSQYNTLRNPFINDPLKYIKRLSLDFNEKYRAQYVKETVAGKAVKYNQPWLTVPTPLTDKLTGTLTKTWENLQVKIITAPTDQFDAVFDDAIKQYKQVGGDEVAKELAAAYKTQYGK